MSLSETKFVEAYRAHNLAEAHVIGLALEEAGQRVVIEESSAEYPPGWSTEPRILVDESEFAAATKIIGEIDHAAKSQLGQTLAWTAGLIIAIGAAIGLMGTAAIICIFSAAVVALSFAYARIRFGKPMHQVNTTRCLACNAVMLETESKCPSCGWTYETDSSIGPA